MMKSMLKLEENKKKGGIGVSSKTKPVAEAATTSKATTKPKASGLLAVKAEEKENEEKSAKSGAQQQMKSLKLFSSNW